MDNILHPGDTVIVPCASDQTGKEFTVQAIEENSSYVRVPFTHLLNLDQGISETVAVCASGHSVTGTSDLKFPVRHIFKRLPDGRLCQPVNFRDVFEDKLHTSTAVYSICMQRRVVDGRKWGFFAVLVRLEGISDFYEVQALFRWNGQRFATYEDRKTKPKSAHWLEIEQLVTNMIFANI